MNIAKKPAFILLFLLISFGSVSAVLFTPALPQISAYFAVNESTAQLTITVFLIGYAIGQLLYGPLANGYGRKKALYIGIGLEIFSSLLCVLSAYLNFFWLLILGRLLMALGASVGLKMSFTLVSDCYSPKESTRIISHLMIAFAITPGIGITIGGFLTEHINWQSCFYFLALYGIFLLYLTYRMPETATTLDDNALKLNTIFHKYIQKLKNSQLMLGAMLMGTSTAFVYVFAALAPFIAMHEMHLNPSEYGLWNLLPPLGIIIGSQLSAHFSKNLRVIHALRLGLLIMSLGVLMLIIAFIYNTLLALWLFLPLTVIYIGLSFVFANASSVAMKNIQDKSTASAMMNFVNMGVATLSVLSMGWIPILPSLLLPLTFGLLLILGLSLSIALAVTQKSR